MKTTFTFAKEDLENEFNRTAKIADMLDLTMQKVNYNEGYEDLYTLRYKFARKSTLIEYILKALEEFPDLFTEVKENEENDDLDDIDWDEVMEDLFNDFNEEEEA